MRIPPLLRVGRSPGSYGYNLAPEVGSEYFVVFGRRKPSFTQARLEQWLRFRRARSCNLTLGTCLHTSRSYPVRYREQSIMVRIYEDRPFAERSGDLYMWRMCGCTAVGRCHFLAFTLVNHLAGVLFFSTFVPRIKRQPDCRHKMRRRRVSDASWRNLRHNCLRALVLVLQSLSPGLLRR
ncbi:unnamed protein product [Hapterophycus canaliculatus]